MKISLLKNDPKEIIYKLASKEFKGSKIDNTTYLKLQKSLVKTLKNSKINIEEKKLDAEQRLEFLDLYNFRRFVNIRLGIYAYVLAIIAIIASNDCLINQFGFLHLKHILIALIIFGLIIITSLTIREKEENQQTIYLKFLLKCIGIIENKNNSIE